MHWIGKQLIYIAIVSCVVIVAWEQVDDTVEAKWAKLGTVDYTRATSSPAVELRSDEERRIEEIKKSKEAEQALDAYAKGVYAEELRNKAEELAQEARNATTSF